VVVREGDHDAVMMMMMMMAAMVMMMNARRVGLVRGGNTRHGTEEE